MNLLHTVFWDLDGTIADTEMMGHRLAFNLAFSEFSLDWTWDIDTYINLLEISGGKNRIKYYANKKKIYLDNSTILYLHQQKQKFYKHLIESGSINLRSGVMRLVTELYNNNINQWIVTTSSKTAVFSLLSKLFPENFNPFSGYITYEDVSLHKPHPAAYYKAIDDSKAQPNNSIVIEDSLIGYQAAKATDLKTLITLSPWLVDLPKGMEHSELVVNNLGDTDKPLNIIHGNISETMITYNSLLSLIN